MGVAAPAAKAVPGCTPAPKEVPGPGGSGAMLGTTPCACGFFDERFFGII